jgi:hypothetical protein
MTRAHAPIPGGRAVADDPAREPQPIPAGKVAYLIATAARAPSVQNTQPWRFRVPGRSIELWADAGRKLRVDPQGREMLISCGAALFGLRLAVRSLGFIPIVDLLPDPAQQWLLARVQLGAAERFSRADLQMLEALPHRHTHRGPFDPGPLPTGLLAQLRREAAAEGVTLAVVNRVRGFERLADLIASARRDQDCDAGARTDMQEWTRGPGTTAHDGVPGTAFAAGTDHHRGRLRQRDFDLGRGIGLLNADGPAPAATAVLLTPGDSRGDWLCAGQALHRVLACAATRWVFASLHTQPLENAVTRRLLADRLTLAGAPQMILQLGPARSTRATARRQPGELIDP